MWSAHLIWANIIMARGTDDGMCNVRPNCFTGVTGDKNSKMDLWPREGRMKVSC